jgi:hypothetical protein
MRVIVWLKFFLNVKVFIEMEEKRNSKDHERIEPGVELLESAPNLKEWWEPTVQEFHARKGFHQVQLSARKSHVKQ